MLQALSSLVFERRGQEEEELRGLNAHREEWGSNVLPGCLLGIHHHEPRESNKPSTSRDLCRNSYGACHGGSAESSLVWECYP